MKLLLQNTLTEMLGQEGVITGIILAAVGLALSLLAKRIARVVRNSEDIQPNDNILLTFKAFGLVCILVALIVMVLSLN